MISVAYAAKDMTNLAMVWKAEGNGTNELNQTNYFENTSTSYITGISGQALNVSAGSAFRNNSLVFGGYNHFTLYINYYCYGTFTSPARALNWKDTVGNNYLQFYSNQFIDYDSVTNRYIYFNQTVPLTSWFTFVLVKNGTYGKIYFNDTLVGNSTLGNLNQQLNILIVGADDQTTNKAPCLVDEISIYNALHSGDDITAQYNRFYPFTGGGSDTTPPTVALNQPSDGATGYTNQSVIFNVTVTTNDNIANVSIYGNFSGSWGLNQTNKTAVTNATKYSFLTAYNLRRGVYIWNAKAYDILSNEGNFSATNYTYTVLNSPPLITLTSPDDGYRNNKNLSVVFTVNDDNSDYIACNLTVNGTVYQNTSIALGVATTINSSLDKDGTYNWNVSCSDNISMSITSTRNFTLETTLPMQNISIPLKDNSTTVKDNLNYSLNWSDQENMLYLGNITIFNGTNLSKGIFNVIYNLTRYKSPFNANGTINNVSSWEDGFYLWYSKVSNSHTRETLNRLKHKKGIENVTLYDGVTDEELVLDVGVLTDGQPPFFLKAFGNINYELQSGVLDDRIIFGACFENPVNKKFTYRAKKSDTLILLNATTKHYVFYNKFWLDFIVSGWNTSLLEDANYYYVEVYKDSYSAWNCFNTSSAGELNIEEEYLKFYVDHTAPNITGLSLSGSSGQTGTAFTIYADCSDNAPKNCSNMNVNITDTNGAVTSYAMAYDSGDRWTKTYTPTAAGTYNFSFYGQDYVGYSASNSSTGLTFIASLIGLSGGGGGGGGGGSGDLTVKFQIGACNIEKVKPLGTIWRTSVGAIEVVVKNTGSTSDNYIFTLVGNVDCTIGISQAEIQGDSTFRNSLNCNIPEERKEGRLVVQSSYCDTAFPIITDTSLIGKIFGAVDKRVLILSGSIILVMFLIGIIAVALIYGR